MLAILPFDSVRKCMSVVMRNECSDEIVLYTKGADSVILEKVSSMYYLSYWILFKLTNILGFEAI